MPVIEVLDGARLYAVAFGGPLAVSVIGMVLAGNWSDRSGPVGPLIVAVALFVLGLLIAEHVGWRWVFYGVVVLCVPALIAMSPALNLLRAKKFLSPVPWSLTRLLAAVVVAIGVLTMDLVFGAGGWGWWVSVVCAIVTFVALGYLLPAGTRTLTGGLPAVIAMRGILSGGFTGAEVYLPYLLTDAYQVTPPLTGASLTIGGLTWAIASQIHHRVSSRLSA